MPSASYWPARRVAVSGGFSPSRVPFLRFYIKNKDRERLRSLSELLIRAHWAQPMPRCACRHLPGPPSLLEPAAVPRVRVDKNALSLHGQRARDGRRGGGSDGRRFESRERAGAHAHLVRAKGGGSSRATAERMRWPVSTCDGRASSALARRGEARVRGRGGARRACASTPSVTCTGAPHQVRRGGKPAQRERAGGRGLGRGERLRGACQLLRERADERKHGGRAGRGFDRGAGREEFPPTDPRSGMWQ